MCHYQKCQIFSPFFWSSTDWGRAEGRRRKCQRTASLFSLIAINAKDAVLITWNKLTQMEWVLNKSIATWNTVKIRNFELAFYDIQNRSITKLLERVLTSRNYSFHLFLIFFFNKDKFEAYGLQIVFGFRLMINSTSPRFLGLVK